MAKLTPAQVKALRAIRDDQVTPINGRTIAALRARFLVKEAHGDADRPMTYALTPSGRHLLDEIERAERVKVEEAERASRPASATAFVEPSASRPVAAFPEYEDEPATDCSAEYVRPGRNPISCVRGAGHCGSHNGTDADGVVSWDDHSPHAVLLTARVTARTPDATDAELLQLLALLDAGVIVTRRLYQDWRLESETPLPLDPERVAAAAAEAVAQHLAHAASHPLRDRYRLCPEPIHLVGTDPAFTVCGVRTTGRPIGHRIRYTRDPDKATHDRCQPPKRVTD